MLKHLTPADYSLSHWSGGSTTQIAIAPPDALYADRAFLWRLSSATVELEESDFTPLPDYNRLIASLSGTMTLSHNGGAPLFLAPYAVHAFDGADRTHSLGRCVDFNLMLRKEQCRGTMEALSVRSETPLVLQSPFGPTASLLLYCAEGSGELRADGETASLRAGETVFLDCVGNASPSLSGTSPSVFMCAWVADHPALP